MDRKRLLMLVEIAIFSAIGLILDKLTISIWGQGGSISLVMLPIVLMAFRWGLSAGLTSGLIIGLLQIAFGGYILHWFQGFLDYVVAFTVVGLAALFRKPLIHAADERNKGKIILYVTLGVLVGGVLRFITHTVGGVVFFAEYAGDQNVWVYSTIYNGSYMLPSIIATIIVGALLFIAAPRILKVESK